jgi:uncharacterized protein (TIGR03067 family)
MLSDQELIQGTWTGHEVGRENGKCTLTVSENNIEFRGAHPQEWYKATFTLDEKTEPKSGDFLIKECPGPKLVGKIAKVVYKIENNTLTLSGNEPGVDARPTSFERSGNRRVFVFTKE